MTHGKKLDQLWQAQFGYGIDCLTEVEALQLCRQQSVAAIEDFLHRHPNHFSNETAARLKLKQIAMVYVWMERPQSADWASYVASPIFHDVVSKLVVLMDIPPDEKRQQLAGQ